MRTRAVRTAIDPWAVVTRAVQVALIYEARAQGLLCSNHQARRPEVAAHHDAERFCERENDLTDYHPAFQVTDQLDDAYDDHAAEEPEADEPTNAWVAAEHAASIMVDKIGRASCRERVCQDVSR